MEVTERKKEKKTKKMGANQCEESERTCGRKSWERQKKSREMR